jgi:hypothetical protein
VSKFWSDEELQILRDLWGKEPIEDIQKVLKSRTRSAIEKKAWALNLPHYTAEIDYEYLKKLTGELTTG